ncbi:1-aminocyclopropane-1-carboxylate synthase [Fistulifera solaris]|uniref:1-aminocyclopropane-1-carboxylate synthase n=1 Tax=Fistulifera solaris TaxID=1519565 RepID=A0A1Z5JAF6_FISSO|nr:1-aminocyclopropane-1-carboxylate synthase [Fistulifera solaris]|eukprot:GAX10741.1 1-aminocyclopropane-1-carboxylate synthase [Fistulifera solaris]
MVTHTSCNPSLVTATRRLASSLSSSRGRDAVRLLPSYLADARSVVRYSPEHPQGALQLGVAESLMLEDWLVPALNRPFSIPANAIYYQPTQGRADFIDTMAVYIEDLLQLQPLRLKRENLIVGAGCNAVLENLCFTLAEAGESVLIPTPYYAAFEFDLVARAGLRVEPVTTQDYQTKPQDAQIYFPNTAALNAAYERCLQQQSTPKILLLSHPHNPLGICYPPSVVEECIQWCRERQIHLISDEIYAGSVYGETFVSALQLADRNDEGLGPYVHWVYALSKDFALSGLRVGAAYTENEEIVLPLQKLNDLCCISSTTQLWTKMILEHEMEGGESWVHAFRRMNHSRLMQRSAQLTAVLDEFQIPYLTPTAGLFVWIDLSRYLPSDSQLTPSEQERKLYLELVHTYGLLLTPGLSMKNEQPGFFRCVFTAATEEEFALSLQRLRTFATQKS